jgi:N6-adenosine-specific RNA methylase IME4
LSRLRSLVDRGFERKTMHAWHKTSIGTGYILRDNCELLLIASRGNPVWPAFGQQARAAIEAEDEAAEPWEGLFDGIIKAAKPYHRHSQKPEIFAGHISRLWPNTPKLEMFYRAFPNSEAEHDRRPKREAAGWYFYGDEVEAADRLTLTRPAEGEGSLLILRRCASPPPIGRSVQRIADSLDAVILAQ